MKTGRSIADLAQEIERQMTSRKDYLAHTSKLALAPHPDTGEIAMVGFNGGSPRHIRPIAHGQIADDLKIPRAYYERLRAEAPALLAQNANHWMTAEPRNRLVRTLDGHVRGWLSDRYRPLDNFDLMAATLPVVKDRALRIESSELTESRLYLKVIDPTIQVPAPNARQVGDVVAAGVVVTNSEIGFARLSVEMLLWQLSCRNGAITGLSFKRTHVGRRHTSKLESIENLEEVLSDEARAADDRALWLAFRDTINAALSAEMFGQMVERMRRAAEARITGAVEKVVEAVVTEILPTKNDEVKAGVLRALIEGGDLTQWGMQAAITRYAQDDSVDYDTATDLERAGGKVLTLGPSEWRALAA